MAETSDKSAAIVILFLLTLIWGSSFILIKKSLLALDPVQVGSFRIIISGLLFLPYVLLKRKSLPWDKAGYILLFALTEVGIPPYLYSIAQTKLNSSTAGILNSLVPLFTLIVGILFFKTRGTAKKISGVILGLGGAFLLLAAGDRGKALDFSNYFGLFIVAATILYAFGGNILKQHLQRVSGITISAFSFVFMSIPAAVYLYLSGFPKIDLSLPVQRVSLASVTILSVVGSALAILLFSKLVQKSNALVASFVTYLIPFVALIWGVLDGEKLRVVHFLALLLILAGIYLVNSRDKSKKTKLFA